MMRLSNTDLNDKWKFLHTESVIYCRIAVACDGAVAKAASSHYNSTQLLQQFQLCQGVTQYVRKASKFVNAHKDGLNK
jgi:hypothetical protein